VFGPKHKIPYRKCSISDWFITMSLDDMPIDLLLTYEQYPWHIVKKLSQSQKVVASTREKAPRFIIKHFPTFEMLILI
jgi:hypothetical protein